MNLPKYLQNTSAEGHPAAISAPFFLVRDELYTTCSNVRAGLFKCENGE